MKRFWGHVVVGAAVAAFSSLVVSACVHDDSSFFIRGVLAPPTSSTPGSGCSYTSDPTQPEQLEGTLDVALASGGSDSYHAVFLMGNQIIAQGNAITPATETSRIAIQGAVVRITDATGNALTSFTTLNAGFVDPPSGATPSYGPVAFTIVDPATTEKLRQSLAPFGRSTVITYTRAFGTTLGGEHVESNEYEFPVTVCNGCLVNFDSDTTAPFPNCHSPAPQTTTTPCFFGQDQPGDCHTCLNNPVCNPGGATPPPADGGAG
jgi:hypothetical protein